MAMHGTTARALELTGRRGIALNASASIPGPDAAISRPGKVRPAGRLPLPAYSAKNGVAGGQEPATTSPLLASTPKIPMQAPVELSTIQSSPTRTVGL